MRSAVRIRLTCIRYFPVPFNSWHTVVQSFLYLFCSLFAILLSVTLNLKLNKHSYLCLVV